LRIASAVIGALVWIALDTQAFIIAIAHPTPFLTDIAPNAQFRAQAPHSMQLSRATIRALKQVLRLSMMD
jgi:hypothetical protein